MSLFRPSTITLFGTGMKGAACAVAEAAVSSRPAKPIAIMVFGMTCVLRELRMQITTARIACEPD